MPFPKGHVFSPLSDRFHAKVAISDDGCWEWQGFIDKAGYGRLRLGGREAPVGYAHRVSYEIYVGPIPEGLHLDHLCRNTKCANPEHLEAVTPAENIRRGESPTALLHKRGVCKNDHSLKEHGCYAKGKYAYCKKCRRERRHRERLSTGDH